MASNAVHLAAEQIERIYEKQIRPALLDSIPSSAQPVAVLVGGQPGAGKTVVIQRLRGEPRFATAAPLLISEVELREFHPAWRAFARHRPDAAQATQSESELWGERLARDGAKKRANLVLETSMQQPQNLLALASELKSQGYRVELIVAAADADASRLGTVTGYERLMSRGAAACFVPRQTHDQAFEAVRETLARLERAKAVDRLRLITRDGRELFENTLEKRTWRQATSAVEALDAYRARELPAREKADNALRWHTLVARLQARASELSREVIAQAVDWRTQSSERALADPQSRTLYEAGLAAETFRTLPGQHFVREFPQYRAAANKLEKAREYAAEQFRDGTERERFVAIARERIAEQIEQGRQYARARGDEEGRTR